MQNNPTLSTIKHDDCAQTLAWRVRGDVLQQDDPELIPVALTKNGEIPRSIKEVWCLADVYFADGSHWSALAMCRGDSIDGPLLWQVWDGREYVPLVVPPAPEFVLNVDGPVPFSRKFNRTVESVLPLTLEVRKTFEHPPHRRKIRISTRGIEPK